MIQKQLIYDILIELKKVCMITSYVIMTYTFLLVVVDGSVTWSEPNHLILYTEVFFLALSWVGFFLSSLEFLRGIRMKRS